MFIFIRDQFVCLGTMLLEAGLLCVAGEGKKNQRRIGKRGFGSVRWLGRYHTKSFGDFIF